MLVTNDTSVFLSNQYLFPRTNNTVSRCLPLGRVSRTNLCKVKPPVIQMGLCGSREGVFTGIHNIPSILVMPWDIRKTESLLDLDLCQNNLWPRSPFASQWLQYSILFIWFKAMAYTQALLPKPGNSHRGRVMESFSSILQVLVEDAKKIWYLYKLVVSTPLKKY